MHTYTNNTLSHLHEKVTYTVYVAVCWSISLGSVKLYFAVFSSERLKMNAAPCEEPVSPTQIKTLN